MSAAEDAPAAPAPAAPAPAPTVARRRGRGLMLALLPLGALVMISECALWLFDAGDPARQRALSAGFDLHKSYFVPDPDVPGGWMTQMFVGDEEGAPEVVIPPKSDRLRVMLFGGSNTEGFPTAYIQEQLQAALSGTDAGSADGTGAYAGTGAHADVEVEVFNLGRHGYGSERNRILFRQALALEPDVAFIYMGHNEFVERGYAMELAQQWDAPWQARVATALTHLRTLNVTTSVLRQLITPPTGDGQVPEPRAGRGRGFDLLQYEQTMVFFEAYRDNYADMLRMAEDAGVAVLMSTVISNDFDPPTRMNLRPDLSPERAEACRLARGRALDAIPPRFVPGLMQRGTDDPVIHLRPTDWGEALSEPKRALRRALNRKLVEPALRPLRAPLDTGPYWTDSSLWSDQAIALLNTYATVVARDPSEDERRALVSAVMRFEEARELVPDHAFTLFEQGLCIYLLRENTPRAVRLLRDAARFDCSPMRGNDVGNGIVRELAAAHPQCTFVDAEEWMRDCSPDRLIGYEVMMDNCHMHSRVLPLVMDRFVPGLADLCRQALAQRRR